MADNKSRTKIASRKYRFVIIRIFLLNGTKIRQTRKKNKFIGQ